MTETESILSKIRKLQNLTTERGATPEEAASAAAKAQALLFEHNLEQADVNTLDADAKPDPYGKVEHEHVEANRNTMTWRRTLLHVIAKNNFCSTVYSPGTTKQTVIGKKSNVETVLYLNECMSRQIADMAAKAARSQLAGKAEYAIAFARGCVSTISARLQEQRTQSEAHATTTSATTTAGRATSNALVIRNSAQELQATCKKFFPHTTTSRGSSVRNHAAFAAGRSAGHTVSMHRGVGRGTSGYLN